MLIMLGIRGGGREERGRGGGERERESIYIYVYVYIRIVESLNRRYGSSDVKCVSKDLTNEMDPSFFTDYI